MTQPAVRQPHTTPPDARPVHLSIRRITLDGYSARQRDHFTREIQAQLRRGGAPEAVARQAAEAILTAVEARLGGSRD